MSSSNSASINLSSSSTTFPNTNNVSIATEDEQDLREDFEEHYEVTEYGEFVSQSFSIGHDHPDKLIQSTALAAVRPPPLTYDLLLPKTVTVTFVVVVNNIHF